jgi:hypothetical protein
MQQRQSTARVRSTKLLSERLAGLAVKDRKKAKRISSLIFNELGVRPKAHCGDVLHALINLQMKPPEHEYEERVAERRNRKMLQAFMTADLCEKFPELDVLPTTDVTTSALYGVGGSKLEEASQQKHKRLSKVSARSRLHSNGN